MQEALTRLLRFAGFPSERRRRVGVCSFVASSSEQEAAMSMNTERLPQGNSNATST